MFIIDDIEAIFQFFRDYNEFFRALVTLATLFGCLVAGCIGLYLLVECYLGFRIYISSQYCCRGNLIKKYGSWAVITGATDGIGKEMAKVLAQKGFSLILIGRDELKLQSVKSSLESELQVGEIITIKMDLADASLGNYEYVKQIIDPENRDIGMLINCAGIWPGVERRYNTFNLEYIRDMINVNSTAPAYLTRIIMPGMLKRDKGLVLNVSSIFGALTVPYSCLYSPTKAFLDSFSRALQAEYLSDTIHIVNLTPSAVRTKILRSKNPLAYSSLASTTPDVFAKTALNAVTTPYKTMCGLLRHEIYFKFLQFLEFVRLTPLYFRLTEKPTFESY